MLFDLTRSDEIVPHRSGTAWQYTGSIVLHHWQTLQLILLYSPSARNLL